MPTRRNSRSIVSRKHARIRIVILLSLIQSQARHRHLSANSPPMPESMHLRDDAHDTVARSEDLKAAVVSLMDSLCPYGAQVRLTVSPVPAVTVMAGPPVPRESNSIRRSSAWVEMRLHASAVDGDRTIAEILQDGSQRRAAEVCGSRRNASKEPLCPPVTWRSSMLPLPVCTTASPFSREMRTSPSSDVAMIGARTSSSLMTPWCVVRSSRATTFWPSIGPTALRTATRASGG